MRILIKESIRRRRKKKRWGGSWWFICFSFSYVAPLYGICQDARVQTLWHQCLIQLIVISHVGSWHLVSCEISTKRERNRFHPPSQLLFDPLTSWLYPPSLPPCETWLIQGAKVSGNIGISAPADFSKQTNEKLCMEGGLHDRSNTKTIPSLSLARVRR